MDLHCHTSFSPDSTTTPELLVERAREIGLDRVAVTDHGTVEGAWIARRLAPDLVIVGEEIRCACRTELIGLFLQEEIPQGLPLEETAERIRDQGGIVYLPHPYAYLTWPDVRARRALAVADAVEAFNSRAFWPGWNRRALRAGREAGLRLGAGSDAHFPGELGQAFTVMPAFEGRRDFASSLDAATPVGRGVSSPAVHVASAGLKVARRLVAAAGLDDYALATASLRTSPWGGGPVAGSH